MADDDGGSGCIDIISGLPDEIREHILCYLPICDAIKTSVLSQKWRFSWTRALQLNITLEEDIHTVDIDLSPDVYFGWISGVLLSHVGAIRTFVLHLSWRDRLEDMIIWLRFLSRNGIEDLRLVDDGLIEFFDLPLSIFGRLSCLTLRKMTVLDSLSFSGFPNLVKLVLINLNMTVEVFEKITSSSLLEVLVIERCVIYPESRDIHPHRTATCPPSLKVLRVVFSYCGLDMIHLNTPNLGAASFTLEEEGDDDLQSNCFDILQSIPKIETITFDCCLHKTSSSDVNLTKLPEMLVNLKTLTLDRMDAVSVDDMSFMFCIIRSAPNLQTLKIATCYGECSCKKTLTARCSISR